MAQLLPVLAYHHHDGWPTVQGPTVWMKDAIAGRWLHFEHLPCGGSKPPCVADHRSGKPRLGESPSLHPFSKIERVLPRRENAPNVDGPWSDHRWRARRAPATVLELITDRLKTIIGTNNGIYRDRGSELAR